MIPDFKEDGNLPTEGHPHAATWQEVKNRFCQGDHRSELAKRLLNLLRRAKDCRFRRVIMMGSFVTAQEKPKDFDLIWLTDPQLELSGLSERCKELVDAARSRERFGCDLLSCPENSEMLALLVGYERGFGVDKNTKKPRGLVILDLVNDELS
jgi:hypothetical protein